MILDIVRHYHVFKPLESHNQFIKNFSYRWKYNNAGEEYNFKNRIISAWFNPDNVRNLGLSRTYPNMDKCQYRQEYCLSLHCSNYLGLFLIATLYKGRYDVLIEDVGGGQGWWFFYLNKMGFKNFHLWDNFSQLSEECALDFIRNAQLNVQINKAELNPIISQNVGVPAFINRKTTIDTELIICYTNHSLEKTAENLTKEGFTFLCKDTDDLAFAYCRSDKYEQFKKELEPYVS